MIQAINTNLLELFLFAIAKPCEGLAYEYKLAEALRRTNDCCLKDVIVPKCRPGYAANRDLFDCTSPYMPSAKLQLTCLGVMFLMRRALRFAAASQRQQLQQDFSKTSKAVMEQMRADLKSLLNDASEHIPYMQFVRSVIPLIKKHDFCPVDSFFYQISIEYSPSSQDPRLQTAQILSYGLKLEDGDTRSFSTLFYFLYSNFKLAMANSNIKQEQAILREGMENQQVFIFMLSRMLPAVARTSLNLPDAWLLLDTYVGSMEDLLDGPTGSDGSSRPYIHQGIGSEHMGDVLTLLKHISSAINHLANSAATVIEKEILHSLAQLLRLLNLFGPSLVAYLCLQRNLRTETGTALHKEIDSFTDFTRAAEEHLSSVISLATSTQRPFQIDPLALLEEMQYYYADPTLERNEHVNNFSRHMEEDIRKTWYNMGSMLSVRGPPKPSASSTQTGQGTVVPNWNLEEEAQELHNQLIQWNLAFDRSPRTAWKRRPMIPDEVLLM
jgi:hypothetical protein